MKLTIFGGTGGVGSLLVPMALEAGHEVTAFARNPDTLPQAEDLHVIKGELHDQAAVARAIKGADAVLSALGARTNTPDQVDLFDQATRTILTAMDTHGVSRLVAISGAGVLTPEDHVTLGRRVIRGILKLVAKHVSEAKEREYELITASDLDWVLVRPPRIVPGPATGNYRVLLDRVPSSKISQGDVADLMLKAASTDQWVKKAPIPGY